MPGVVMAPDGTETQLQTLLQQAHTLGERLKAAGATVAVAESSSGGLISAALLAVPGASAYYQGGAVVYTARARMRLMGLTREDVAGMRSASEPYALLLARSVRAQFGATWGVTMNEGPLKGLLSRAVVVTDENNTVLHVEQVPEIAQEPDYDGALKVL